MIPKPQRQASSASTAADTENLHTDVMRFMAILGLCLAAIFALVQSVPMRDTDKLAPQPSRDPAVEQERLDALRAEVERLSALIGDTQQRNHWARQALATTREQLSAAIDDAGQARRERERMASEMKELSRRLQRKDRDLRKAEQTAQAKSDALLALQRRPAEEQSKPRREQVGMNTVRPSPQSMAERKRAAPAHEAISRSDRQGFSLRFASSDALARLVSAGTVSLYGMAGRKAWRLSLPGGRPVFTPETLPDQFHEMTPATVPPTYVQALAATPGGPAAGPVVWGVRLPAATQRAIADLTRGRDGGDLVIGTNGQVYLNEQVSTAHRRTR